MFAKTALLALALRSNRQSAPIPIVGPSGQGEVAKLGQQRSVNWFPIKPEREGDSWTLRGRPGLSLLCSVPRGPIRGWHVHNDRLFAVAAGRIYEIYANGTYRNWGKINSARGRVVMASLLDVIVIGDGAGYYALDLAAGTVAAIADAPRGRFCVSFDQRILYQGENGQVFYSELNDPTNIDGLNFFTAESLPDTVEAMVPTEDQLWLIGADSAEVWYDSGDADNPFQRIGGGVIYSGTSHPYTALRADNAVWWVDNDKDGGGIVRRSNGFTLVRVSTSAVERFTRSATNLSAFTYQEDGSTFYCLNADEGSWAYDLKTGEWHERAWLNRNTGDQERHRPEFHAWCYGKHLVADYATTKVYEQSLAYHSDAGQEIRRTRVTQRFGMNGRSVVLSELWLDFATAVGLDGTGQGTDPLVMLRVSGDGVSFGSELTAPLGAIGEYATQVRFFDLGLGRDWVLEISVSDPVFAGLMGGEVVYKVGRR
jgi:hypothetical protein